MGKRRGTYSGRYGSERFTVEGYKMYRKDQRLKVKNRKKYNKRRRVARYMEDGKISSKEAKKLIKRGISQQFVENQNIREYRQAQKRAENVNRALLGRDRGGRPQLAMPGFEPLKISTKASTRFLRDQLKLDEPQKQPQQRAPRKEPDQPVSVDPIEVPQEPTFKEPVAPTSPYGVENPITIRNPAKRRMRGGIGQFSGGSRTLPNIKSKLLNI